MGARGAPFNARPLQATDRSRGAAPGAFLSRPPAAGEARPATSVADAYRFFVPLMLMAELMMISHAVIAAFLARMPEPQVVLAAYTVAFYTHAVLGSPLWALQIIVLSWIRDRASVWRLAAFGALFFVIIAAVQLLLGLTPLGDWFFGELFGTRPVVVEQAKLCMVVSIAVLPVSVVRSLCYGLMMIHRRTLLVTLGTVVRMLALAAILALLTRRFEGAVVGVAALAACIGVETVYAVLLGLRYYRRLRHRVQPPPGYRELWHFSWPIMLMQTAESGMVFTVNFFLGRLIRPELALAAFGVLDSLIRVLLSPLRNLVHTTQTLVRTRADARAVFVFAGHLTRPELALAAFGVLDSLIRVLLSPLRNLVHTTQTLVRTRADARAVFVFAGHMAVLFAVLLAALQVPAVRHLVLYDIMGLTEAIATTIEPALGAGVLLALAMAAAGVFRGMLIASHRTGFIAITAGLRVGAAAVVGGAGLLFGVENGATLGIAALRLRRLDRQTPRLFEA